MGRGESVDGVGHSVERLEPVSMNPSEQMVDVDSCCVGAAIKDRVASVTLDRPPLNVMNIVMMDSLHKLIMRVAGRADVLIFRGAGEKGFSAGVDIADHVPERVAAMLTAFHGVFRELARSNVVTVAAVHGHCLGGGCELATFCDFVIASESAIFGQPEIKLGCFPPVAMVTFPRLIGMRAALDLILSGRTISAAEAKEIGLVTQVVPDHDLDQAVASVANDLRTLSPSVLGMARRALWNSDGFDFERALQSAEDFYLHTLMKTHDAKEGIRAFLEKRQPSWQVIGG